MEIGAVQTHLHIEILKVQYSVVKSTDFGQKPKTIPEFPPSI